MIKFTSSTIPKDIDIRFFWEKEVAFVETNSEDIIEYIYLYNGSIDKAIPFLSSIGFCDIKIVGEIEYTSGYFAVKRTA